MQVRCHASCPWMANFVVTERLELGGEVLYRVQRRDHPRALPSPLPGSDVRPELAAVAAAG